MQTNLSEFKNLCYLCAKSQNISVVIPCLFMPTLVKWREFNYVFTYGPHFCFPYFSVMYFHISVKYNYITLTRQP